MPHAYKILPLPTLTQQTQTLATEFIFNLISVNKKAPYKAEDTLYKQKLSELSASEQRHFALLILEWLFDDFLYKSDDAQVLYDPIPQKEIDRLNEEIKCLANQLKDPLAKSLILYPIFKEIKVEIDNNTPCFTDLLQATTATNINTKVPPYLTPILPQILKELFKIQQHAPIKKRFFAERYANNILNAAWETDSNMAIDAMADHWENSDWNTLPQHSKTKLQEQWKPLLLRINELSAASCKAITRLVPLVKEMGPNMLSVFTSKLLLFQTATKEKNLNNEDYIALCTAVYKANDYLLTLQDQDQASLKSLNWTMLACLHPENNEAEAMSPAMNEFNRLKVSMHNTIFPPETRLRMLKDSIKTEAEKPQLDAVVTELLETGNTDSLSRANERGKAIAKLIKTTLKAPEYTFIQTRIKSKFLNHLKTQDPELNDKPVRQLQNFWLIASLELKAGEEIEIAGQTKKAHLHILDIINTISDSDEAKDTDSLHRMNLEYIRLCPPEDATEAILSRLSIYAAVQSPKAALNALTFINSCTARLDSQDTDLKTIVLTFLDLNFEPSLAEMSQNEIIINTFSVSFLNLLTRIMPQLKHTNILTSFRTKLIDTYIDMLIQWAPYHTFNPSTICVLETINQELLHTNFKKGDPVAFEIDIDVIMQLMTKCTPAHPTTKIASPYRQIEHLLRANLFVFPHNLFYNTTGNLEGSIEQKKAVLSHLFSILKDMTGKNKLAAEFQIKIVTHLAHCSEAIYAIEFNAELILEFEVQMEDIIQSVKKQCKALCAKHCKTLSTNTHHTKGFRAFISRFKK